MNGQTKVVPTQSGRMACGCIVATSDNTASVRKGFEVGGYIKDFCAEHAVPDATPVAIGDSVVVSELAQKMAVKGAEVVKALFKMGVMATINQTIDHDTAALVVEEMGHNPVRASGRDAEEQLISHAEVPEREHEKAKRFAAELAQARAECERLHQSLTTLRAGVVGEDAPQLTEQQWRTFLSVAFRHCDLKGSVRFVELQQGLDAALGRTNTEEG